MKINIARENHLPGVLLRRLESIASLTEEDLADIAKLPLQVKSIPADMDIVKEGDQPSRAFLLLEGWVCSYKLTGEGKRQIPAFHVPGDMPDLHSLHLKTVDTSFRSITECRIAHIEHRALHELFERHYRIASAFWRMTLIDASILREWETNIGQRSARTRVAHLLCEMLVRLRAIGLSNDHGCELPITQQELADASGLTSVHVNRMLQELRGRGLIVVSGNRLQVLDWPAFKVEGDFDAGYLHLEDPGTAD
jgi:CRP-like cAMP-binding protein